MMENKLRAALCALLLINLGSADHTADGGSSHPSKSVPEPSPPPGATTVSAPNPISHAAPTNGSDTIHSSSVTSGVTNETATEERTISTPLQQTNDTKASSPSDTAPETDLTDHLTSQPSDPAVGNHTLTSQSPLVSITASPTHPAYTDPVKTTQSTMPLTNTSHHSEDLPPISITASNQPIPNPSAPTSEPPKNTSTTTSTTTTSTQSSTTSSTSSSSTPPTSKSTSLQPDHRPENSGDHQMSTTLPASNPTAQAKAHVVNPSQLNVGGDTTVVHDSPTLDPLLAGLVSAFIITAIIITLLLFLKLRRRDNRPEFRRLQDLPMDDMMEDTPLSMYSY